MYLPLVDVGILALIVGAIFVILEVSGEVSADTDFGRFSGDIGPVAVILGIVLMAIGVLVP